MLIRFSVPTLILFSSVWTLVAAAPPNNNLGNATVMTGTNVTVTGTNVGATKEIGEPNHGSNAGGSSVWWKWTAPGGGSVVVDTAGSTFDTVLAAYTGTSIATLSLVAQNDDSGTAKTSLVGFNVSSGTTYLIAVDGYDGVTGDVHLSLSYRTQSIQRPINDNFADRINLSGLVVTATGANYFATKEPHEPDHADELGGASIWWTWTAPLSGKVEISTEGSCKGGNPLLAFDTLLAVYTGSALTNLIVVASNDDISTNLPTSLVTFTAVANTPYQIAVDGYDGEPGDIQLHITMQGQSALWLGTPQLAAGGAVKLTATAPAGKQVALGVSTNLPTWTRLSTQATSTGTVQFTDQAPANSPRRFYRLELIP